MQFTQRAAIQNCEIMSVLLVENIFQCPVEYAELCPMENSSERFYRSEFPVNSFILLLLLYADEDLLSWFKLYQKIVESQADTLVKKTIKDDIKQGVEKQINNGFLNKANITIVLMGKLQSKVVHESFFFLKKTNNSKKYNYRIWLRVPRKRRRKYVSY